MTSKLNNKNSNPFINNLRQKKEMLVYYMMTDTINSGKTYKNMLEKSIKKRCVNEVREYNNTYKNRIVLTYINYLDMNDECWCGELPHYKDIVIGYIKYKNTIIPYTEETSIETFHTLLINDDRFEFCGDKNDLNFQFLFSFLTSVGFLQPRDENGNKLFEVVSIFSGANKPKDINVFMDLTQVIQKRYKHENKHFEFHRENIKPITTTASRKKLTLKSVNDCFSTKQSGKFVVDCGLQ